MLSVGRRCRRRQGSRRPAPSEIRSTCPRRDPRGPRRPRPPPVPHAPRMTLADACSYRLTHLAISVPTGPPSSHKQPGHALTGSAAAVAAAASAADLQPGTQRALTLAGRACGPNLRSARGSDAKAPSGDETSSARSSSRDNGGNYESRLGARETRGQRQHLHRRSSTHTARLTSPCHSSRAATTTTGDHPRTASRGSSTARLMVFKLNR